MPNSNDDDNNNNNIPYSGDRTAKYEFLTTATTSLQKQQKQQRNVKKQREVVAASAKDKVCLALGRRNFIFQGGRDNARKSQKDCRWTDCTSV